VVTIGTFDGIHRGHQEIFRRVQEVADQFGLEPVLVTFHPHPRTVVSPDDAPMLLTSIEEKEQFLPDFFDGTVLILHFNRELMNLTALQFVTEILLNRIGASRLVVGSNHGLGKGRSGTAVELKQMGSELGFDVEIVNPVSYNGEAVSSSRIRKAMIAGEYDRARELLGHDYAIFGTVEHSIGLGRKLGYPTANVRYSPRKLLPPDGVYACWTQIEGENREGMMFIGQNHFNPEKGRTVEANLFDFDRDIYDREIIVYPTEFIRPNQRFDSTEALTEQIHKDKESVIEIMSKGEQRCR